MMWQIDYVLNSQKESGLAEVKTFEKLAYLY